MQKLIVCKIISKVQTWPITVKQKTKQCHSGQNPSTKAIYKQDLQPHAAKQRDEGGKFDVSGEMETGRWKNNR